MGKAGKKGFCLLGLIVILLGATAIAWAVTYQEVDIKKVPKKFRKKSVERLPGIGIRVWDAEEVLKALKSKSSYMWVDTRPSFMYDLGSIKGAKLFVYHKKGQMIFESQVKFLLTRQKLRSAWDGRSPIVFFCQGPKCHRSYNAAIRAVQDWGLPTDKIIWFREGYPGLLRLIQKNPALKRSLNVFFQGDIVR